MDDNFAWLEQPTHEPALYLKRLAIYDDPKKVPFREVPFRRGLNIVWAIEPTHAQAQGWRAAGHGVGKTSLCLLLRYCLGDESPNTTKLRKELASNFPKGGVALIVDIQGQSHIVYRSFKYRNSDRVVHGETLTELWSHEPAIDATDFFDSLTPTLLHNASCARVPETDQPLEWRHLLAWLARDQEARFKSFYAWREGEGIGLSRSRQDPPILLRSVLGLMSSEEGKLLRQLASAKQALEATTQDTQTLLRESDLIKARIEAELRDLDPQLVDLPLHAPDLFSPSLMAALGEKDAELNASLEEWQNRYRTQEEERQEIFRSLHPLEEEYHRIDQRLKRAEAARARNEKEFSRLTSELDRLKALGSDCQEACIPFKECTHVQDRIQKLELPNIQDSLKKRALQAQMEEVGQYVDRYQRALASKHDDINLYKQKNKALDSKQNQQLRIRDTIIERAARFMNLRAELERWESTQGSEYRRQLVQTAAQHEQQHRNDIARLELPLQKIRQSLNSHEKKLESIMQCLTECLLGDDFFGSLEPQSDERPFGISAHGGEAYRVLEILLGDLSCLFYSVGNTSAFPGILIHDCPREADMGPKLYEEYVTLVAAAERHCEKLGNEVPFQYIITTTTPPPEALSDSEKVVLKLHPEVDKELLFRQKLVVEEQRTTTG
ncbi:coiled-coil domain-containing protein [Gilvimarinus agarilyticus]|uniref:hypothetical protein n=1 Tax=Gilvimarinus agarilyticus TaxID=679259 RepID=UPI0005A19789|nr:hypothetical protein [Gilvimarinus agarilyticus]